MELILGKFTLILKRNKWERFGSQELLIERLLGCSTGTELTPILPSGLAASPQMSAEEQRSVCSNGTLGLRLATLCHSSEAGF